MKKNHIHHNSEYLSAVDFARQLRKNATDAEQLCWQLLRNRRLLNTKFRRQHPFPPYTLDFYCVELQLAIELDGSQHADSQHDTSRDKFLADNGVEVLRFYNNVFFQETESVLETIYLRIIEKTKEQRTPSPSGRGLG